MTKLAGARWLTATLDGQPVTVDRSAVWTYTSGNGPFSGFVTYTFSDGSTLGVSMQGERVAASDSSDATFNATLDVIGGTGRSATAKGNGTFVGTRSCHSASRLRQLSTSTPRPED